MSVQKVDFTDPVFDLPVVMRITSRSVDVGGGARDIALDGRTPVKALLQEAHTARSQAYYYECFAARCDAARAALEAL